ncbi:hypothetical protein Ac2012v2_005228 [Leucoagaricus gongylophorus]
MAENATRITRVFGLYQHILVPPCSSSVSSNPKKMSLQPYGSTTLANARGLFPSVSRILAIE